MLSALFVTLAANFFYGIMPARWLCEFDELPTEMHLPGFRSGAGAFWSAAVLLLSFYANVKAGLSLFLAVVLVCVAAAAISDMEYMIIPDQLIAIAAAAAILLNIRSCESVTAGLRCSLEGAVCAGGLMLASALLSFFLYGTACIGFGDVKLMLVCGALAGSCLKAAFLFVAAVMSSTVFISFGLMLHRLRTDSFIPMAPFIALAAIICM
jgi:Flp pilus assembly protein protease CpaA